MNPKWNKWLEPPTVIALVVALFSVVSFYTSFNERLSKAEIRSELAAPRLERIERKLDDLGDVLMRTAK